MPIARIIYTDKADNEEILKALHDSLQGIIGDKLSTSEYPLKNEDIELVFEKGHHLNRGKDLKILVDGNDLPERTENLQQRSDQIADLVECLICPLAANRIKPGFVYVTLQAGGLGKFKF